ncbi:MAG: PBP1A family penicillin-binding protein [Deltaproteobacteria bacterium]|nr:PBP1A family penicillin-binding protein [Deltaproteobacteria bacterium]
MLRKIFYFFLITGILCAIAGAVFVTWGYFYITRDLPQLTTIQDYSPKIVSTVQASDGTVVAEFYEERRYPVKLKEVPPFVRNCFLAAEDATFYSHPGIDPVSILRAVVKNLRSGQANQGGSTITQQVVKNLLLTPEKNIRRKAKEAILSYRLEQSFTKDEILEIYLNQIFFGNTAYGIKAAALTYFHKNPSELTLAEASMLAGLPKAPSRYSPLTHFLRAKRRQRYVLDQMVRAGFVTPEVAEKAYDEKVKVYAASADNIFRAPYYVSEVRRIFSENPAWKGYNIDTDGLRIETALNLTADGYAVAALRKGLREVDKRRGWRGPVTTLSSESRKEFLERFASAISQELEPGTPYPALVTEVSPQRGTVKVDLGYYTATVNVKEAAWAKKRLDKQDHASWIVPEQVIRPGDVIEVSVVKQEETKKAQKQPLPPGVIDNVILDQTPVIEGAVALIDPNSGKVATQVGGYSYQVSQFNRVTQSFRQPGSSFKPILYLAAVDGFKYTPATIVYDQPRTFRVGDEFWTPGNYEKDYLGAITLRTALERSRNLVSADIISRIGVDAVIQYARKLGVTSKLGHNLSLSLGSSEVTLLELVRAYGVFAARGTLFDTVYITRIVDRNGKEIFNFEDQKINRAKRVINEDSAFLMANMMKGVVEHGTGYRIKEIGRPVAGKTGTTNDQMDCWFIGYTPNWVAGVWVGFDQKKEVGDKETGGRVAAPVWLYLMREFLNDEDQQNYQKLVEETKAEAERLGIEYVAPEPLRPLDFSVPDGVDPFWINKATGLAAAPGSPGAFLEYFVKGTEPSKTAPDEQDSTSYLESPDL